MIATVDLHITAQSGSPHNGATRLASAYFTPPFKIANVTEDKHGPLQLMLMCSSPGILDGDEQTIRITLEPSTRLQLHTQSYQRLFQMTTGATQSMEVRLGKGAAFCWLPHPITPHKNSIFKSRNRIHLAEDAQLVWGEVLTCGRKLTGEVFTLSCYHSRTEIYYDSKLVLLENLYVNPGVLPPQALGQLEGFTHQASLLTTAGDKRSAIEEYLSRPPGNSANSGNPTHPYGITIGPGGILVIRLLGNAAEPLHQVLKEIATLILEPQSSVEPEPGNQLTIQPTPYVP